MTLYLKLGMVHNTHVTTENYLICAEKKMTTCDPTFLVIIFHFELGRTATNKTETVCVREENYCKQKIVW